MNSLGSSSEIVQNKLIILYIMDRLDMPVSNKTITRLVLESRLMNYFMFQQCFSELEEGRLLGLAGYGLAPKGAAGAADTAAQAAPENPEGYVLTDSGRKTLRYFLNLLPQGLKKRLDKLTMESHRAIRLETLVTADYTPESEDKFTVLCKMEEKGFPLIELKAAAGTRKDARELCENWKKHSSDIYAEIMQALLKKRV